MGSNLPVPPALLYMWLYEMETDKYIIIPTTYSDVETTVYSIDLKRPIQNVILISFSIVNFAPTL